MAAAALCAWPLAAQDSAQAVSQPPARHVVQAGETLWSLAQLYLGDPFLWPEIYRLNTLVVEDPHWIFPGEELLLAQADQTAAPVPVDTVMAPPPMPVTPDTVAAGDQSQQRPVEAPPVSPGDTPELAPPPPPPPSSQSTPTVFARTRSRSTDFSPVRTALPNRAVHGGDFYAAGFLTENEDLPYARVLGPVDRNRGIERRGAASATRYERIVLRAPDGATYHTGDSVLIAVVGRRVPRWGNVVIPSGIARVVSVAGREVEAEIVTQFDRITDGQVALPVEPFRDPGTRMPMPVEQGLEAEIVASRDNNALALHQSFLFIDKGRTDGLVPGDIFELLLPAGPDRPAGSAPESLGLLQIVHVRDATATGRLLQVYGAGIGPGTPARLIRKMPG